VDQATTVCVGFRKDDTAAVVRRFREAAAIRPSNGPVVLASSWGPDPTPGDIPAECQTEATRVTMCGAGTVWGNILDTNGRIVGRADVDVLFGAALSNKSLNWRVKAKAVVSNATGVAALGTISAAARCSGGCSVSAGAATPLPLRVGDFMHGFWDVSSTKPGTTPIVSTQSVLFTFAAPTVAGVGQAQTPAIGTVRCDNSATIGSISAGCVYPAVNPVFLLNGAAAPASPLHAAFVKSALAAGKPGSPGGVPLTRLYDPAKAAANRNAACKNFVANPSPPGTPADLKDSCDEFPFAKTFEGGANSAVGHVPLRDNTNGGNKYAAFIAENRLLEGEKFFIVVVG